MIKSIMMGDFDNGLYHERRKTPCPECGGWMSEGAKRCNSCQATARGRERSEQWAEQHEPERQRRHRRVRQIMDETGLSAIKALDRAKQEWGE